MAATGIRVAWRRRSVRTSLALVCLALIAALQLVASSSSLHQAIHPDATLPGHHCAVTLLLHGGINTSHAAPAAVIYLTGFLLCLAPRKTAEFSPFDYRPSPSRAPPCF